MGGEGWVGNKEERLTKGGKVRAGNVPKRELASYCCTSPLLTLLSRRSRLGCLGESVLFFILLPSSSSSFLSFFPSSRLDLPLFLSLFLLLLLLLLLPFSSSFFLILFSSSFSSSHSSASSSASSSNCSCSRSPSPSFCFCFFFFLFFSSFFFSSSSLSYICEFSCSVTKALPSLGLSGLRNESRLVEVRSQSHSSRTKECFWNELHNHVWLECIVKTFISCYRTPGPRKGSEGVFEGVSEGFLKGFRRVLEGVLG